MLRRWGQLAIKDTMQARGILVVKSQQAGIELTIQSRYIAR